ncbi:MAG: FMN-binding protein, partial [Oscillospiraceae bacterium]|nr:FMN-binding protein [Oscillospiraceae bacterium]
TLTAQVMEAQSAEIDGVAGASLTSTAVRTAVADALSQAADSSAEAVSETAEEPETEEMTAEMNASEEAAPEAAADTGKYLPGTYTAQATGMGTVVVTVTVDESSITEVVLDTSGETPEIGGAANETLTAQVMEAQSAEIDGVAGASLTSTAVRTAVADALSQAAAGSEETAEENSSDKAMYVPGTYRAEATGMGKVVVTVTVDENAITEVVLDTSGETPEIGGAANETLTAQVMEAQSAEIDGVAGASFTSTAVRTAVADALSQAAVKDEKTAEEDASDKAIYVPGTYRAEATGMGKVVVNVTVDEHAITEVVLDTSGETPEIGGAATETLSTQVMDAQGAEIDGVAGASLTSQAVKTAVAAALEKAAA